MPIMDTLQGARIAVPSDREIVLTRAFAAPRELVFDAWTRAEHVARWWDPAGVPLAACDIDLRPGGAFRFVNAGAHGPGHAFAGVYREIVPPSRLVLTTPAPSGADSTGTLEFAAFGDTTLLTMTIACVSRADRDALLAMRVDAGTARTLDNLAAYLGGVPRGG